MSVALFDVYNENTKELLQSLKTASIPTTNLFVRYFGELPEDAICPFTYFGTEDEVQGKGLFFNQVEVPEFYEIRDVGGQTAHILNGDRVAGKILYRKGIFRKVERVQWFSQYMRVLKEDLYNTAGKHYASNYFLQGKVYQTAYLKNKKEVIWENYANGVLTLHDGGKVYQFNNLTSFFLYFIERVGLSENEDFIINSLSYPLFILRNFLTEPKATLFWQEEMTSGIPGNLDGELKEPVAIKQVIFKNEAQLKRVMTAYPNSLTKLAYLSPIGEFTRKNNMRMTVFNLTASDEFVGLEELLREFPKIDFCVAAKTSMSDKLLNLGSFYDNLTLLPTINDQEIKAELEKADIYLDINQGMEVEEIIKKAYKDSLLVLAEKSVAKNRGKSLVLNNFSELKNILTQLSTSKKAWKEILASYHEKNGKPSTVEDYRHILK